MSRLLVLAFLVVGCGGPATSTPPSPSVVVAATAEPTPSPTLRRMPRPSCSPVILAGIESLEPLLQGLAVAVADEDPEAFADVAFRAGVIAREVGQEVETSDDPTLAQYADLLEDLEDAADTPPTTTAEALPLIEALGALVDLAPAVEATCS